MMAGNWSKDRLAHRIVEEAQDAVIFADREGLIRLWNKGAEAIFGYTASEAEGRSLDLIIPEKLRPRHWEGYRRVMAAGATRYGREVLAVPGRRKDGSTVSLEFTIILLKDDDGKPLGTAAIMRDVTARWEREKALKKRLAEFESQREGRGPV